MKTLIRSLAITATMLWSVSAQAAGASRIGNDYYEDIFPAQSCNFTSCSAQSSSVTPAGVYLRMQHFYCRITTNSTSSLLDTLDLQIWTGPQGQGGNAVLGNLLKSVALSFSQPVSNAGSNYYNIDHDILLATGAGRIIVIAAGFTASTGITIDCSITGNLIPPPAQ
jgi:hypothetical protein